MLLCSYSVSFPLERHFSTAFTSRCVGCNGAERAAAPKVGNRIALQAPFVQFLSKCHHYLRARSLTLCSPYTPVYERRGEKFTTIH